MPTTAPEYAWQNVLTVLSEISQLATAFATVLQTGTATQSLTSAWPCVPTAGSRTTLHGCACWSAREARVYTERLSTTPASTSVPAAPTLRIRSNSA